MSEKIKISAPLGNPDALAAIGRMFLDLADAGAKPIPFDVVDAPTADQVAEVFAEAESDAEAAVIEAEGNADDEGRRAVSCEPTVPEWPDADGLDSAGFAWDERIHSGNQKTKVKDGRWTYRRGVDPEVVERVEAERAAPAPAVDVPAPPAQLELAGDVMPFPDFMKHIAANGYNTVTRMTELAAVGGLNSIAMVATRPDLILTLAAHAEANPVDA